MAGKAKDWRERHLSSLPRGEAHKNAKLTYQKADIIRASSESHAALSREYGVSETTIAMIRSGLSWSCTA